jgi:outer membrane protein, heavy metal efflux system
VKPPHSLFLSALLAAASCAPLGAQQPPQELTLASALDLAEKQNLDLVAERAQRAVALAGIETAGQRPNPTANFAALRDTPHESLFFDLPVEIGPKRKDRILLARQEQRMTETDVTALERQVRQNVRDAYFNLGHAQGVAAQQTEAVRVAERLHQIAEARFQTGDIPQLDVIQADLEAARAHASLDIAQQEEKVALSDLNALLNEPAATDWSLGGSFETMPPTLTLDDLQARAASSNVELAKLEQTQKVQQSQTALFKAERIPDLGLEAGLDFNSPGKGGFRYGPRGGVSMEMPLFSRNQGEIAGSQASEQALESQVMAAHRAVDAQVTSAYHDVEAQRNKVEAYRNTIVPSAERLEKMAEESYQAGAAPILTVLTAQQAMQQVQLEYLDGALAMHTAFSRLELAVGAPLD